MKIGLHLDGVPQEGLGPLDAAAARIGPVAVVHWFQAWGGGHRRFHPEWLDRVAESGRQGLISWEPWALTGGGIQPGYGPHAIARGDHDGYIRSWAQAFGRRGDGPWYLRPMHEMNGTWYPWGGRDGAAFQRAWRHVRSIFDDAGAGPDVVRWVWCPLADDVAEPFERFYPG